MVRHRRRILLLLSAAGAVLVNAAGSIQGYTVILSHLFYFPVILTAYWYPRRCHPYLVAMGLLYVGMVALLHPSPDMAIITATVLRATTFTIVGFVVSFLSYRLKDSEQQLFDTLDFLPDPAFAIDRNGAVVVWNKAMENLTGVDRTGIIGRDDFEYAVPFYDERRPVLVDMAVHDEYRPEDWYDEISRDGDILETEGKITRLKKGKNVYLQFRASPLRDHRGKVTGGVESVRDITDTVIMESALSRTTSALNRIAGIATTDLSDRLTSLFDTLRECETEISDPAVTRYTRTLRGIALDLGKLVTRMREFRDIGTQPPSWRRVIVESTRAAAMLPMDGVSFRSWTERLEIFADPNLHCVFYHLFENSLNTGEVSRIIVTYQIRADGCAVIVEDDGPGIAQEDKVHLLERSEGQESPRGLYVAGEILSLTGMTLVENGTFGRGARFEILVPPDSFRVV